MLTVRAVAAHRLRCAAVALSTRADVKPDFVSATNEEVLRQIAGVPIIGGVTAEMVELPSDWQEILGI